MQRASSLAATLIISIASSWAAQSAPLPTASRETPCTQQTFENSKFWSCVFDSRNEDLRLVWTDRKGRALRQFSAVKNLLGSGSSKIRFTMNAGMFDERGTPIGLYIENGLTRRPLNRAGGDGNFYLKPNGVFWIDRGSSVHITTTANYSTTDDTVWATQSGPTLLADGNLNPQISADGPSRNIRNAVGIRDPHTAIFVISDDAVSFGKLARFFRDDLKCPNALYLDGAVSSLWAPGIGRMDQRAELGPMVIVLDRE